MNTSAAVAAQTLQEKYLALNELLREKLADGLIVAFSGGVDSAFLTWAAEQERKRSGGRLSALTTISASFSRAEKADAERFSQANGFTHLWFQSQELLNPEYAKNDSRRCFHCKTELFRICREAAEGHGFRWIAYGYNASDRGDTRPGHIAAVENEILSPLADVGLSKDEIRTLMRQNGLEMADKPASPCLSSRLMTGVTVTAQKLMDIEEIEAILRDGGLMVFRVRMHEFGETRFLRLEVEPNEMPLAIELREKLVSEGRSRGYAWVTIDLAGYKTGGGNAG